MTGKIVPTKLPHDRWMYSSYRVGDKIYWTKHRLLISADEILLTDGTTLVRSRCGNRLSDVPERPVQVLSPPAVETGKFTFDIEIGAAPTVIPEGGAAILLGFPGVPQPTQFEIPNAPSPPLESGEDSVPSPSPTPPPTDNTGAIPPIPFGGGTPSAPITPIVTPEPITWIMLATGLLCLCGATLYRRYHRAGSATSK
jgi:hypothetical protein